MSCSKDIIVHCNQTLLISFPPSHSLLPLHSFLHSFLPSFLPSFLHHFITCSLPFFLPSFLPSFLPLFLPSSLPSFLHSSLPSFVPSFLFFSSSPHTSFFRLLLTRTLLKHQQTYLAFFLQATPHMCRSVRACTSSRFL